MSTLQFIASMFSALAWPVAVAAVILTFRPQLRELLPHLKSAKLGPITLTLERAVHQAAEAGAKPVPEAHQRNIVRRLERSGDLLEGATILWVDDQPGNNDAIADAMTVAGARVRRATSTKEGLLRSQQLRPQVVITDMERDDDYQAGQELADALAEDDPSIKTIFYVLDLRPGVPRNAFGITNMPDELLHLVLDALERQRR
jgi:CheY-like chemotaxis protein